MTISSVDRQKVTPMMRQYLEIKDEHPDLIIMFRLGDFYEVFFEDAVTVSHDLELTLTGRNAGLDERIPMCGVPHHSASVYIDKLIDLGYRVGICEQLEDPKDAKGIVKRGITQIISRGTVIDSGNIAECDFNYMGNVIDDGKSYFLGYTDITTGVLYLTKMPHNALNLVSEIVSLGLKEVVVESSFDKGIVNTLKNQFKIVISICDELLSMDEYANLFDGLDDNYYMVLRHLLSYLSETKMMSLSHLQCPIIKNQSKYLKMDIHTKRNLELVETLRLKQRQYSLIWLLDKTKTAMGSRLLKTYIENPLVDVESINKRLDVVETLMDEFLLHEDLQGLLYEVYDLERLSGRIAFGNANARDMLQLKTSLRVLPDINNILRSIKYKEVNCLEEVYALLDKAIYETPPVSLKEGYLIKEGYSKELDELKSIRSGGKDFIARFETEEKQRTGIRTLKVGYNRVFGYYIEVSKGMTDLVKEEYGYERKQTLSNSERYISPILKEKEALILNAEERIIELEYNLFNEVKDKVKEFIPQLQEIAKVLSEIDVLQSFAKVAEDNNYIRPEFSLDRVIDIKDNRHGVVEQVLSSVYVANDIKMDNNTDILLITGPNMAGKSTYMRQLAITVIMAQIGSFVPASYAKLPIFDAIYTRIGASDDLVSGESTFMVEMNEANKAITNATKNSLVLFDELGRGTATYDGMALAQAIIEYIHDNVGCKMIFSTHYHELTDLEKSLSRVKNVHVSAYEEDGKITFLHKIKEGSVDKSYGIHVASLAHLPTSLIKRADEILLSLESGTIKKEVVQQVLPLEDLNTSKVEEKLKNMDVLKMTPMDAINELYKLKDMIE